MQVNWNRAIKEIKKKHKPWTLAVIGDCDRKLVLHDLGFKVEPFDAKTLRLFALGKYLEEQMAEELKLRGHRIFFRQELVIFSGRRGRIDGAIRDENFIPILWENKSINHWAFAKLKKKKLMDSYPQYYDQIQSYMAGWNETHDISMEMTKAYITIQNKNTSDMYDELIDIDKERIAFLEGKIKLIDTLVRKGILPPPINPKDKQAWKCKYCNFAKACNEAQNG